MKNYRVILALDPSGNFSEGKGTTGVCLLDARTGKIIDTTHISAEGFSSMEAYWQAHINLISTMKATYDDVLLVIEDYLLYGHKKDCQVNSRMETPKLIGVIQHFCYRTQTPYIIQTAAEVKNRWSDEILKHKELIIPKGRGYTTPTGSSINRHEKDAIRHAIHTYTFKLKEGA